MRSHAFFFFFHCLFFLNSALSLFFFYCSFLRSILFLSHFNSGCKLSTIPAELSKFKKLVELLMDGNKITEVPATIVWKKKKKRELRVFETKLFDSWSNARYQWTGYLKSFLLFYLIVFFFNCLLFVPLFVCFLRKRQNLNYFSSLFITTSLLIFCYYLLFFFRVNSIN